MSEQYPADQLLSTGSTMLNLALSGTTVGGLLKGKVYGFVGDSSSGKTFLCLTCMAEAAQSPHFKDYSFVYDNVEDGALMDMQKFFGERMAKRLRPPAGTRKSPGYSSTIDEFYFNLDTALQRGPCIYVLDSMDALSTMEAEKKFKERKKAAVDGTEAKGTFGVQKAKTNSEMLRRAIKPLTDTGSILIIISQTRDNLGFGFETKTRGGGRALKFYAALELWASVKERIKKTVRGKPRTIGIVSEVKVKKNRLNGRERSVRVPIYHSVGIDDLGGMIRFLIEEKHWKGTDANVTAPEFDWKGPVEGLISQLIEEKAADELMDLVQSVWDEIEEKCEVIRERKYQ